jgi:hypothetical protein
MFIRQPDRITLFKSNGTTIPDIPAWVQSKITFINDRKLAIEEGDFFERTLPNGLIERYQVVDRGYYSIPQPHYQVKHVKISSVPLTKSTPTTIIHQHGDNPRVTINSTDLSSNVITKIDLTKFEELKQIIDHQISDDKEKMIYLNSLDELKSSVGEKSYLEKYNQFIATVANHMAIITPFIPFLTSFIH